MNRLTLTAWEQLARTVPPAHKKLWVTAARLISACRRKLQEEEETGEIELEE